MKELRQEENFENLKRNCLSNIYERGVDDAGFGRIRSKGDQALFGGFTTKQMKERLGVQDKRPLADFFTNTYYCCKEPCNWK